MPVDQNWTVKEYLQEILDALGGGGGGGGAAAAAADNTANPTASKMLTFPHWFDGATWDRAPGNSVGGAFVQGPVAQGAAATGTNPMLIAGTSTGAITGNVGVLQSGGFAADTVAPTTGLFSASFGLGFNGANWSRMRVGTDGVLRTREERSVLVVTPTIAGGVPYALNDTFGSKNTITSAHPVSGGTVVIEQITIINQGADPADAFDLYFWGADPSSSTFTDNAAPVIAAADKLTLSGYCRLTTSEFITIGGVSSGCASLSNAPARLPLPVTLAATTMYMVVISQSTNTYAVGDVQVRLKVRW